MGLISTFRLVRSGQAPLRLLLPFRCLVCNDPGHDGLDLCPASLAELPWSGRACLRSGCRGPSVNAVWRWRGVWPII
ncbi:double zinc ribbon domain-containing protein [Stenotrophomonas hibiscicola]|uniref:double zinc ribbon domain-containing protein n=1 Tax=Stenotrophomonas hibiscicola TaxID=86189 RepID=UPI003CCBF7F0